ncbi:MAG: M42 family peptidase [Thermoplasmata archaeon]|nr:M42 family metallopeptidase [Euryarchaeota archaeon]RLF66298.1 MAG: M42 family peptidase [Thermoplasmata archaeon]
MTELKEFLKDSLRRMSESFGISGYEDEIRNTIIDLMKPYVDEVKVDTLGNVIGVLHGKSERPKIMLAAHMDQIGFLVKHIDDKGYLYLTPVGGWDPRTLLNVRVKIYTRDRKFVRGVIGSKPPHILKEEEKNKPITFDDLFVDIGAKSKEDVEKLGIRVGAPAILDFTFTEMANDRVIGLAFDDRSGVAVMLGVLKILSEKKEELEGTVYAVATVQEEVGLRGARTSAFAINPDVGIAIDVTIAADVPGVPDKDMISKLGGGPAITIMDATIIANRKLNELFEEVAKELNIPLQYNVLARGGTDAGAIHLTREGVPSTTLSIPSRYIHSGVEVVDLNDIENASRLLAEVIKRIKSPDQFKP